MSLVNHRTNNPGASDIYGYCLGTVPNQKTAQFPKGVTIDGSIMPVRDINDFNNGTNTWKELHGEDLYFIEEGSYERILACEQFSGSNLARRNINGTYPNTYQNQYRQEEGYIPSYAWKHAQGNWKSSQVTPDNYYSGLAHCFSHWWLNISSETQLPNDIMTWPNGADLEVIIPQGQPYAGEFTSEYPDLLIGKLDVSDMTSRIDEFQSGSPLSAESVRKMYRDMEKLRYYVLSADIYDYQHLDGYHMVLSCNEDYINLVDGAGDLPSSPGYIGAQIVFQESTTSYWGIWHTFDGDFYLPMCGKELGDPGSYNPMYGSEVAVYAQMRLQYRASDGEYYTKLGLFKVPYIVYPRDGITFVYATDLITAAYKLINKYNAEIPHSFAPSYQQRRSTYVGIDHLFSVCKVSDRTDTTQLNWNLRPQ